MTTKHLLGIILTFFLFQASAQERYKIIYDYQSDEIGVFHLNKKNQIDDTLKKPVLKRNSLVELELKNVNPFAVEIQPKLVEENFESTNLGFNPGSLLSGITSFHNGGLGLNVKDLPSDDIFTTQNGVASDTDSISAAKSRGARSNFDEGYSHLKTLYTGIEEIKSRLIGNLINPNLSKEEIIDEAIRPSFIFSDDRLAGTKENFYIYLAKLEEILSEDSESMIGFLAELNDLEQKAIEGEGMSRGARSSARAKLTQIEETIGGLKNAENLKLKDIRELKSLYTALEASSFEQTTDYTVDFDRANINLDFKQSAFSNDLASETDIQRTLKSRKIKVFAKGGIKINTSVAITLNNYKGNSKSYFKTTDELDASRGIVGGDDNNFFTPNLSTMINFYPVMGESFNLGGSFGLSIPISTADGTPNGINFLIGPSLFFGTKSRVSFSGGLAYGPVNRL
ncbi:unnamed protein product, partial [Ectocarpus sp. 12 AP-2014]